MRNIVFVRGTVKASPVSRIYYTNTQILNSKSGSAYSKKQKRSNVNSVLAFKQVGKTQRLFLNY